MTDASRSHDVSPAPGPLPEGRLQGRRLFADLVRQSLATAAAEGWQHLVLCDTDFSDWPLGERAVVASLQAWAHLVEVRACGSASTDEWPSAIWSPVWTLERIDVTHGVVVTSRDARRQVALAERLDHWWHKGSPSLPPTTLGL